MTRSRQERVERLVCAEHCRFFKPWEGEEIRCGGFRWLLSRAVAREETLESVEKLRGEVWAPSRELDPLLLRSVCTRCDYYPARCSYLRPAKPSGAVPCGAMTVLQLLLERALVVPEDFFDPTWCRGEAVSQPYPRRLEEE